MTNLLLFGFMPSGSEWIIILLILIFILPFVGLSNPDIQFNKVVFPDPDGPKITIISPLFITKLTLFNAWFFILPVLYVLYTFLTSIYFIYYSLFKDTARGIFFNDFFDIFIAI